MRAGVRGPCRRAIGLYVHLPFCATRCAYCTFVTGTELDTLPRTLAAVGREVESLTRRCGGRVRCTPRGWLVSNELLATLW